MAQPQYSFGPGAFEAMREAINTPGAAYEPVACVSIVPDISNAIKEAFDTRVSYALESTVPDPPSIQSATKNEVNIPSIVVSAPPDPTYEDFCRVFNTGSNKNDPPPPAKKIPRGEGPLTQFQYLKSVGIRKSAITSSQERIDKYESMFVGEPAQTKRRPLVERYVPENYNYIEETIDQTFKSAIRKSRYQWEGPRFMMDTGEPLRERRPKIAAEELMDLLADGGMLEVGEQLSRAARRGRKASLKINASGGMVGVETAVNVKTSTKKGKGVARTKNHSQTAGVKKACNTKANEKQKRANKKGGDSAEEKLFKRRRIRTSGKSATSTTGEQDEKVAAITADENAMDVD